MAEGSRLPPKKDVARAMLLHGSVFVHLDPRSGGVVVPAWLSDQPQLVLQIGLDMPIPIPDLRVDDDGFRGTLSFNRAPFECRVGWDSVFALVGEDGRGLVWPDSMPAEILAEVEREVGRRSPPDPSDTGDENAEVVQLGARREERTEQARPARRGRAAGRRARDIPPYLRVVK